MKKSLSNIIYIIRELKWKLYFLRVELNCKNFNIGDNVYINPKKINKRSELYKLSKQGEKFKIFDKDEYGYKIKTEKNNGLFYG